MLDSYLFIFTGVNGRSILFELNSIRFPVSFPVDIMHGLFENVAPAMLRHWSGIFFKDDQDSGSNYVIPNNDWTEIGIYFFFIIIILVTSVILIRKKDVTHYEIKFFILGRKNNGKKSKKYAIGFWSSAH